jgi:hypothetical protein
VSGRRGFRIYTAWPNLALHRGLQRFSPPTVVSRVCSNQVDIFFASSKEIMLILKNLLEIWHPIFLL